MNDPISFFKYLQGKTVAFAGIGVSHTETIKLFARQGVKTIACDRRDASAFKPELIDELDSLGVKLVLGGFNLADLGADIVFRTPGMYFLNPEITAYRQSGGIVTSEMEVFFQLCPCPIFAVTGSDGKTTTTTLISEFLKTTGKTIHLGGNIGRALLPEIFDISPDDYAVVELSSFQLISMRPAPMVSVVTNVTPNHLDIHSSMEEYIEAKKHIFLHQNAFSKTVLDYDDPITNSFDDLVRGCVAKFSLNKAVYNGAYLKGDTLTVVRQGVETPLFNKSEIRLPGIHNVANYLTAIAATDGFVESSKLAEIARTFGGVEHRIEFIREHNGVKWFNDSIATSPNRAMAGIRSFSEKLILIAGGYDKNLSYDPLAPDIISNVKLLILTGATSQKIKAAVKSRPNYKGDNPVIIDSPDLAAAVEAAHSHAQKGDTVILSPASASFDAYPNFEERGKHFKSLVNNLK